MTLSSFFLNIRVSRTIYNIVSPDKLKILGVYKYCKSKYWVQFSFLPNNIKFFGQAMLQIFQKLHD